PAGGIRHTFRPPRLILIADHINLMFKNPLVGPVAEGDERFPDMSDPYDPALRRLARDVARTERIPLEEGVYAGLLGPSFETPAEIRMLQRLGADAVGMSTVPEVIAARARGVRCLGFSSITNVAAGLSARKLSHRPGLMGDAEYAELTVRPRAAGEGALDEIVLRRVRRRHHRGTRAGHAHVPAERRGPHPILRAHLAVPIHHPAADRRGPERL